MIAAAKVPTANATPDFAATFADFSTRVSVENLSAEVIAKAKADIFDTLACAIGGVTGNGVKDLAKLVTGWGGTLRGDHRARRARRAGVARGVRGKDRDAVPPAQLARERCRSHARSRIGAPAVRATWRMSSSTARASGMPSRVRRAQREQAGRCTQPIHRPVRHPRMHRARLHRLRPKRLQVHAGPVPLRLQTDQDFRLEL